MPDLTNRRHRDPGVSPSQLLTAVEAGERLRVVPGRVLYLGRIGAIPRVVLGTRTIRFEESAIDALVKSGGVGRGAA